MKQKSSVFNVKSMKEDGTGLAVFATLNCIDKDGDWTPPGAFGTQVAKLCGAHDWGAPSIGIAKIYEKGEEAVAEFKFNLDMPSGLEWYKSVKFNFDNGIEQEYSYGFDVLEESFEKKDNRDVRILKRVKVWEVSPVMIGAGMNTHTVGIKGLRLDDQGAQVEEYVREYFERCKALATMRRHEGKEGRVLSRVNRDRLTRIADELGGFQRLQSDIQELLASTDKPEETVNLELLGVEVVEQQLVQAMEAASAATR